MEAIISAGIMVFVGALIGGVTNFIAIKMLFRPYQPVYLFGKRVPFTPGLIPKRRGELAFQLGKMVVEHLVTPEGIKKRMEDHSFHKQLQTFVSKAVEEWLKKNKTVEEMAGEFGIDLNGDLLNEKLKQAIKLKVEKLFNNDAALKEVLPEEIKKAIEDLIPAISKMLTEKGAQYFESLEGREAFQKMIGDFFLQKGTFGSMIQMFLGNMQIADKLLPEAVKFFRHQGTIDWLSSVLFKEWHRFIETPVSELANKANKEQISDFLAKVIIDQIPMEEKMKEPVSSLLKPYQQTIKETMVPKMVSQALAFLQANVERIMQVLHIDQIVADQVESFSVERLEQVVSAISKKELKMITYLGALLGGIVGFIQSIIILIL